MPIDPFISTDTGTKYPSSETAISAIELLIIWIVENRCAKSQRSCDLIDELVR